jgi:HSP20 family protein
MALPTTPASTWLQNLDVPSELFETGSTDYELYEEDGEFVLSVEMPGFDPAEIEVTWDDGVLNIAGDHENEARNRRRTYHRRFRFPKRVDDEEITAEYTNGILEVRLPVEPEATARGTEIEVTS